MEEYADSCDCTSGCNQCYLTQDQSLDDLCVWPDGTVCYRHELSEFTHMSDDYRTVPVGTAEHARICFDTGM